MIKNILFERHISLELIGFRDGLDGVKWDCEGLKFMEGYKFNYGLKVFIYWIYF
jgi:hypothetical protein